MTLREIHERCAARHAPWVGSAEKVGATAMCVGCDLPWPCPDYSDAVAALAILDDAELISEYAGGDATEKSHWRYVPDPEPNS